MKTNWMQNQLLQQLYIMWAFWNHRVQSQTDTQSYMTTISIITVYANVVKGKYSFTETRTCTNSKGLCM